MRSKRWELECRKPKKAVDYAQTVKILSDILTDIIRHAVILDGIFAPVYNITPAIAKALICR
jgi:hypothetical protein